MVKNVPQPIAWYSLLLVSWTGTGENTWSYSPCFLLAAIWALYWNVKLVQLLSSPKLASPAFRAGTTENSSWLLFPTEGYMGRLVPIQHTLYFTLISLSIFKVTNRNHWNHKELNTLVWVGLDFCFVCVDFLSTNVVIKNNVLWPASVRPYSQHTCLAAILKATWLNVLTD